MHNYRRQEKRVAVVNYYIGEHGTLTDVLPTSGWTSYVEGGNIGQALVAYV